MIRRDQASFIAAATLSLAVHATAAVYFGHYPARQAAAPQSAAPTLQLSLAVNRPAALQAVPAPVSEPEPVPPPEPPPPPQPKPRPVPKPVAKPKPQPAPRKPPVTDVAETTPTVPEQTAAAAPAETVADQPVPAQVALVDERETYLARLLAHIDSHKFYPRSARRRGEKGEVRVSFYLLSDGAIRDLQITGGSKTLRLAARQAIQNALALPPPPASLELQAPVSFGMVYRLDS
jgi:protein TonB